jgi:hypothetical protein
MNSPSKPTLKDTPLVFLGLCERANYVREGNTNIFKWNIIGLKTVVLSHIFPLKVSGLTIGFAFLTSNAEKETKFRLVNDNGKKIGTLNLFAKAVSPDSDKAFLRSDGPLLLVPEHGWTTAFLPLNETGWVIETPGVYYLEQVTIDGPIQVGTLRFAAVDAAPLSAERIAAIKSEPNATKAVRIELGCKHCPSKFRAYAALERSDKTECEGWMWYQEVPELFKCECGKTTMDLQYINRNLHGLLGHRHRDTDQLSFMPLYEKSSLETTRTNFVELISRSPREELLQKFIEENPILLHQFPAERIIPKPPILTFYNADFGIVTPQKELILIELEKTTTLLMKKNGDIAAPLNHAFDQVRNWLHKVDEHRLTVLDSLQIEREAVSSIRGVVVAGRDVGYDARDLRKLKGVDYGRIAFLTYDDLLFAMDALIRRVETI